MANILQVGYLLYDVNVYQKLYPFLGEYAGQLRSHIFAMHHHRCFNSQEDMIAWIQCTDRNATAYLQSVEIYEYDNMTSIIGDILIDDMSYTILLVNDSPYNVDAIMRRMKSRLYVTFDTFAIPLEFVTWLELVNPRFSTSFF